MQLKEINVYRTDAPIILNILEPDEFRDGDEVFSYYEKEGKYFVTGKEEARTSGSVQFTAMFAEEGVQMDSHLQSGHYYGSQVHLGICREGKYYKLTTPGLFDYGTNGTDIIKTPVGIIKAFPVAVYYITDFELGEEFDPVKLAPTPYQQSLDDQDFVVPEVLIDDEFVKMTFDEQLIIEPKKNQSVGLYVYEGSGFRTPKIFKRSFILSDTFVLEGVQKADVGFISFKYNDYKINFQQQFVKD